MKLTVQDIARIFSLSEITLYRWINQGDIPAYKIYAKILTKKGHTHAIKLAKQLKDNEINFAYRSSLTRAKQTLDYFLAYHPNTEIIIDDRIIERDYGELASIKKSKYKKKKEQY